MEKAMGGRASNSRFLTARGELAAKDATDWALTITGTGFVGRARPIRPDRGRA